MRSSWHPSQRMEVPEHVRRLARNMPGLVRSADGSKVAPRARSLCRRCRKKAQLDGAVDNLESLEPETTIGPRERHWMLGKTAGRRRIEQPPFPHGTPEDHLDGETVDDRLQRAAAADDRPRRRPVPPRLVICDPQLLRSLPRLDQVHRAAENEPIVNPHRLPLAACIASLVG